MNWQYHVKIKHLFTEDEDHESVQKSMNAVADVIVKEPCFRGFNQKTLGKMRNIPEGDDFFTPVEYANKLLDRMYDFADENSIWIE